MEAIATLERWYRRREPDGSCGDVCALRRWAAAWLGLWPLALCVAAIGGGPSWRRAAALTSLTLVAGAGALARWTCRAATKRAAARCVAVAVAIGTSAVVVGLALRFDVTGGIKLQAWLVPALVLVALPVVWDRSWAPSHRTVRTALVAVLALGGVLAGGMRARSREIARLDASRAVLPPLLSPRSPGPALVQQREHRHCEHAPREVCRSRGGDAGLRDL